jgi:hypothetical protein
MQLDVMSTCRMLLAYLLWLLKANTISNGLPGPGCSVLSYLSSWCNRTIQRLYYLRHISLSPVLI